MSLTEQIFSGIKWTSVSSIFNAVVQFTQTIILAHYLSSTDFGLMAMVMVVIGFSQIFVDMGISGAIIHEKNITHVQLSSLYWLNIALGLVIFLIIFSLAQYIANFYNEPLIRPLIQLLSLTFIIISIGNQYRVLFQKELEFDILAKIGMLSTILTFILAVSLAIYGYGVYAIVYASLFGSVVNSLSCFMLGIKKHQPSLVFKYNEITKFIRFGSFRLGAMTINYFNSQFDVILIGKLLGTEALGVYSIAKNLSMRPAGIINPIITNITFPVMAKIQDETLKLKSMYLKSINYLSSINFPIYLLIAILAEPIVLTLLGEKWKESIPILQILSLYAAFRSTANPMGSLQLAKGRADLGFYWNLSLFFVIPLSIYSGSSWGLIGVAYTLLGLQILLSMFGWYFMIKPLCGAGFKEYYWQIIKPLMFALAGGLLAYKINIFLSINNIIFSIIMISAIMGVVVIVLHILYNRDFTDTIFKLIGKKK